MVSGEPYTLRGVRTVRGGVLGNLLSKYSEALGAYPTIVFVWLSPIYFSENITVLRVAGRKVD
nr:hypothetical protein [uncultured Bacillus sp.]